MAGALVMWMAAGFAMLEAGMVRAKNTAEILTKNIVLYAVACIMFMFVGYNLMYSAEAIIEGYLPALDFLLGGENDAAAFQAGGDHAPYYAARSDFFFQVVFVAAGMSIVSGAVAERMKLWSFLLFAVIFTAVIYPVQGYWSWGGGWLAEAGFSDFAGSGIVHMCGASAALAGVLLLGSRKGKYGPNGQVNPIPGANMPLATLGTFILWMGWFGFNGGSTTAGPSAPSPLYATLIGAAGGIIVVLSIITLDKLRIDDPVGAISVHGVVGMFGLMVVPLTNAEANFGAQALGLAAIFAWTFIFSLVVWSIIKVIFGLRVTEEEEYEGVDISECGLEAYPEFAGRN